MNDRADRGAVVLVAHGASREQDRAARHLAARGYGLRRLCPAEGDALPRNTDGIAGTILYGGGQPVTELDRYPFLRNEMEWVGRCMAEQLPVLGLCLGGQLIAHRLGADVHPADAEEYGYFRLIPTAAGEAMFGAGLHVSQAHFHEFELPDGAELLARSETFRHQAFRYGRNVFAFQFHPEVTPEILSRWVAEPWQSHDRPGAHSAGRQMDDCRRYDRALDTWFTGFLDRWLGIDRAPTACWSPQ